MSFVRGKGALRGIWHGLGSPVGICAACVVLAIAILIVDLVLPRGATPAMGYCAVIVLAAIARTRRFFTALVLLCTALTWMGYILEPPGAPAWMSAFDRAMVTWVLWLTAFLSWHREQALAAVADKARDLEAATCELARSNTALERFASVISHDLRSPLASLGLMADVMATSAAGQDRENAKLINSIRRGVDDMAALIQDLLTYSRAGHGKLDIARCACEDLIRDVLSRLAAPLQSAHAKITHDPLPVVMADDSQLSRVFQNLIENAIKYSGNGVPEVHITASEQGDQWTFSVRDHGPGIAPGDSERIFELFQRGRRDTDRRPGAGVGLSVCKTIVQRHGGRIWVASEPGRGATFSFTIPKHPQTAAADNFAKQPHDSANSAGQSRTAPAMSHASR